MTDTLPGSDPGTQSRDVLASLPRQDRHKPKGPEVRESKVSRWRAYVLIGIHVVAGLHIWHYYSSGESITPVEPSEAMFTVELGRINAGFILFLALIASTLIFGRFFCGWACHVVALQDLCAWLLKKAGLKPRPVRSRLLILVPWVVGGYMFIWPMVHAWLWMKFGAENGWTWLSPKKIPDLDEWDWALKTDDLWERFPGFWMAIATFTVVGGLIVWWLGAKGFCTYGCPYGAFFATADRVAPIRIKVNDDCEHCGHCTTVCTSNVRVHEEVAKHGQIVDPGCMKCLDCVSVCPKDALSVGFTMPKPFAVSQQRIKQRADFVWWEEVLMGVVAFVAVQFVFRGAWFGDSVPLLMAVGIGSITAVMAMLFVRLLAKSDVRFQHSELKVAGKRTGAGTLALLLVGAWMLFTAHTFVGQRLRGAAVANAGEPVRKRLFDPQNFKPEVAQQALDDVEFAKSWVLVPDPKLREVRGLLLGSLGRDADAEHALGSIYDDFDRLFFVESKLMLARQWGVANKRLKDAEKLLLQVIESDTNNPFAPMLLSQIRRRMGG